MRPMPELKIEVVRTDDLLPYAGNAKIHTATQIDQIAESIKQFGNNDPIAVWHNADGDMEIVEGHGRLMALSKLDIEEVPVIFLDHLSDAQRRAYTHIHNQLTMNTGFDTELLQEELEKISDIDMVDLFGFSVGPEVSSEEWVREDYAEDGFDEDFDEQAADGDGYADEETFNCLFVYHGEEEEAKLCAILGVDRLKPVYEIGELL